MTERSESRHDPIEGRTGRIKAYSIAIEVFGHDASFDAQSDPAVRIEAGRIRRALERYHLTAGRADPLLITIPKGDVDEPARKMPHGATANGTVDALKKLIAELLPEQRPTIERVAPRLAMSIRTLQRRLHDWGHSFTDIADETRRDVAIERLTAGETSITETAFLLGYSDLSHFTRAFRRWTGMTPREFAAASRETCRTADSTRCCRRRARR